MAPTESCCAKSVCTLPGVMVNKQHCCTLCHGYMHGLACGEGKGWFEGGADSYACKLCFDKSRISFMPISANYAKSLSPRDPMLLQDLIWHHPKLINVKRHKKNNGATNLDASDKEFVEFYSKYKKYLDENHFGCACRYYRGSAQEGWQCGCCYYRWPAQR
jgi:hypothetical protein